VGGGDGIKVVKGARRVDRKSQISGEAENVKMNVNWKKENYGNRSATSFPVRSWRSVETSSRKRQKLEKKGLFRHWRRKSFPVLSEYRQGERLKQQKENSQEKRWLGRVPD